MKLKSVEEVAQRRETARSAISAMLNSPIGEAVLHVLADELELDRLIGIDTHDTYRKIGRQEAYDIIKQLGGLHD